MISRNSILIRIFLLLAVVNLLQIIVTVFYGNIISFGKTLLLKYLDFVSSLKLLQQGSNISCAFLIYSATEDGAGSF
jgi:hypothetical protein